MTPDSFRVLIQARPFRPYRLRTAGGREIAVTTPEAIGDDGEHTAVVLHGDRWEVLDINMIESIVEEEDGGD